MRFRVIGCLTLVLSIALIPAAYGDGRLADHHFDAGPDGWKPFRPPGSACDWTKDGGRGGSGGLHVRADGPQGVAAFWRYVLANAPRGKALKVSGWVRGRGVETLAGICIRWLDKYDLKGFASSQTTKPLKGDFEWTHVEATLDATGGWGELDVLAFVSGKGEAWFDDVVVEPAEPRAPGLFLARGAFEIQALRPGAPPARFLLPLPLSYREQVPLTYELAAVPASALTEARIYEDRPGNFVADISVKPSNAAPVVVRWSSIVLCAPRSFDGVPKEAPFPASWPAEARPWLRSTKCVQAADPRIKKVAAEILRVSRRDVLAIIAATIERVGSIRKTATLPMRNLDALEALDRQVSCTGNANFMAALLRANGIPTRVLAGYATWFGPHQTHYIIEAFVPGWGWYPIESTLLKTPRAPCEQIEVSIVPPEYEDMSELRAAAMAGVPHLSLTEHARGADSYRVRFCVDDAVPEADHVAELWRQFQADAPPADWDVALDRARARWSAWLASSRLDARSRIATPLEPGALDASTPARLAAVLGEAKKS